MRLLTQENIFEEIGNFAVNNSLRGYNCSVFAYGQTGAGKSWSMFGSMEKADLYGAVPRSANVIFDYARKQNEEDASS